MLPLVRRGATQGFIPSAHASGDWKEFPEAYTRELQNKATSQWSSHPPVRGPNGMIYVFTPELQNKGDWNID